jgi:fatty acid desaturase
VLAVTTTTEPGSARDVGAPDADAEGSTRTVVVPGRERYVSEYAELSRQIQASGLLERRYVYYWIKIIGLVLAFAAVWVVFAFLGDSWFQLLVAASLAVVLVQFGFLGHDAAHRQIFASQRWNEWTARVVSGLFSGLSYRWWVSKHNRHHLNPNKEGADPDLAPGAFAFTPAAAQRRRGLSRWLARWQGYYFFPLLLLEGLALHVTSIQTIMRREPMKYRWCEAAFITSRMGGYLIVLFAVLPPGKAAAFLGVQMGLLGLLLGGAFAPNHTGMPLVPHNEKIDFLRRQVLMSRNIRGGWATNFALGGLNYQIEHHLFPSMPRPNLRRAQPIVRDFCSRHRVTYTETSLFGAYRIVVRYLNQVGLGRSDPFRCPLVVQYRA